MAKAADQDSDEQEHQLAKADASSSESDSDADQAKLGDKLFDSDSEGEEAKQAIEQSANLPADVVRQIILADSPELLSLLEDFQESLSLAKDKLLPLL